MDSRRLFEALVREHSRALHVFLRAAVRDPGIADDVFQETLVVAWRSLDRFDPERSFGRWLRGIARNRLRHHLARAQREQTVGDDLLLDAIDRHCESLQRSSADRLDERLDHLRECIDALPGRYRRAIDLRYRENVRGARLAARLETTWDSTKKLLLRGRRMLFECMSGKWRQAEGTA